MLLVDIALRLQNELLSINPQLTDPPPMITMEFWSRTQLETFRHALREAGKFDAVGTPVEESVATEVDLSRDVSQLQEGGLPLWTA